MKIQEINWKAATKNYQMEAKAAYNELERIRGKHDGELRPEFVVDASRSKRAKLHHIFEWDDETAAEEYRKQQAGTLIRSLEVVYEEAPTRPTRAYEIARTDRKAPSGRTMKVYKPTDDVMSTDEGRDYMIGKAILELRAFQKRYRTLQELGVLMRQIQEAIEGLTP